jgi:hypothetical protein
VVAEFRRVETISRGAWRVAIETAIRLSCTADAFLLRAILRAQEGKNVCHRAWNFSIPRGLYMMTVERDERGFPVVSPSGPKSQLS